jgi:hypothetical protein
MEGWVHQCKPSSRHVRLLLPHLVQQLWRSPPPLEGGGLEVGVALVRGNEIMYREAEYVWGRWYSSHG